MNNLPDQDNFSGHIRNKVHDYAEEPSTGLWDKLDARIPDGVTPARKKRVLWWVWMPAVAILTGTSLWWFLEQQHPASTPVISSNIQSETIPADAAPQPSKQTNISSDHKFVTPPQQTVHTPQVKDIHLHHTPTAEQMVSNSIAERPEPIHHVKKPAVRNPIRAAVAVTTAPQANMVQTDVATSVVQVPDSLRKPEQIVNSVTKEQVLSPLDSDDTRAIQPQEPLAVMLKNLPAVKPELALLPWTIPPPVEEKKDKWTSPVSPVSIALVNGINYSFTRFRQAPERNFSGNSNRTLNENISGGRINYSGGISVGIRLSKRLMLSGGVRMTTYSERYNYDLVKAYSDPANAATNNPDYMMRPREYYRNPGDSIVTGNAYSFINRYYLREAPVALTWYMPLKGRWSAYVEGGFSYYHVSYANGAFADEDRVGFVVFDNVESYPRFQSFYSLNVGAGVSYMINPRFSVEGAPSLRYGLGSMIADQRWVQQTPLFPGLNMTLRRHF